MNLNNQNHENRKRIILALSQAKGIGYYSIRKLYAVKRDLEGLLVYSLDDLIALFIKAKITYAERLAHAFYDNKQMLLNKADVIVRDLFVKRKINFILDDDPHFPEALRRIPDNPYWLFVEGNITLLSSEKTVAIVGTRHPTQQGIKVAESLARLFVGNQQVIVSGLADGIDAAAHNMVNQLKGLGIAVLGCGINLGFPASTFRIRQILIANGGAVISEYMINDSYGKQKFVWRDRLQSGLAQAVFPVQGTLKSGTVHTIKYAERQNKKIIGVFQNRIEDVPQNELFKYLKEKTYPVYDLTLDQDKILSEVANPQIIVKQKETYKKNLFDDMEKIPPPMKKISMMQKVFQYLRRR